MKRELLVAGSFAAFGGLIGYFGFLFAVPWSITQRAYKMWTPVNQWHHSGLEAGRRGSWVKIGNPDFIVSRAVFDLSGGPLRFTGRVPNDSYWSLAFYDEKTMNFAVINDTGLSGKNYEIIVTGSKRQPVAGADHIQSPVTKGYVVVRILARQNRPIEYWRDIQRQARIGRLGRSS